MAQRDALKTHSAIRLGRVLRQVFLRRGFVGMMGMTWGFMLGGALLMIWMTTAAAICGLSAFNTGSLDVVFGIPMLAVYWVVANDEYREHNVVNLRGFLRVFLISFFVSVLFPLVLAVAAITELLERRSENNLPTKEAQGVFAAVGQQVSGLWGGHSAHNS